MDDVNPYSVGGNEVERPSSDPHVKWRVRFDWRARRTFFRSILPMRLVAIVFAVITIRNTLPALEVSYRNAIGTAGGEAILFYVLLTASVAMCLFALYMCWTQWTYADAVVAVVGGKAADMQKWSHIHLQLMWLHASAGLILLSSGVLRWLISRLIEG